VIFFSLRSAWLAKALVGALTGALIGALDMEISPVNEGFDFT
jgi:hypothetical protein